MEKIVIIGGGAAGMAAGVFLGEQGHNVHIFEKNEKLGKKLFITGKGRCNLTNSCDEESFFRSVVTNSKFLYSSFYGFTNQDTIRFFEDLGLKIKEERGGRIFPVSDHSSDVIGVLEKKLLQIGVKIHLKSQVQEIWTDEDEEGEKRVRGILLENGARIEADRVIVATGGCSYQATGSAGDGYRFAQSTGHTVTEIRPALVPIETEEDYITSMQGLSLKNVEMTIRDGKKVLYKNFGELLFTHFGMSGPLVLTASSYIGKRLQKGPLTGCLDLKPALTMEQLDRRLLREFEEGTNKQFKNVITGWFPAKLYPVMLKLGGISPEKKVHEITRGERNAFLEKVKNLPFTITGLRDFNEAIITQGGVKVKEIDPGTMESKKVKGLYFIGEVLDVDAVTGGFNLQIAWSTAKAAAKNIE
ncbi:MAG TPA: NAD(P)/FAD-dependent oxidoreductase [Candidatus Blautia merdigallinarum]|uniref:NAD(P)/FAD-dependent oxidoreductase n=1 Tax=Candidatus Blautia merdigallinarum TaxID=2838495 RepID=A0A9D2SIL3_9FIRM|nr:NAD(P)/FAD-dependent oxidoreductase [Candidatus Blautia merdigallinarum]